MSPAPFRDAAAEVFGRRLPELLRSHKSKSFDVGRGHTHEPGGGRFEEIHLTHLQRALVEELQSRKLLDVAGETGRMSRDIAHLYRTTLANVAGQRLLAAPVTADIVSDVAAAYFAHRDVRCDLDDVPLDGFIWARLAVPFPSPEAVGRLSIQKLVDLRTMYGEQRRSFREKVQARATSVAALPSVEAIRAHLNDFAREIQNDLELHRDALHATRVRTAWTLLGVSAPISAASGLTALGAPPTVVAMGGIGFVGLGVTDWFLQRGLYRRVNGHYLLSLETALRLDHGRFSAAMHSLVHGE